MNQKSLRKYLSHIFYVYTEAAGAVFMLAGAALVLACGWQLGFDNIFGILAWHAALLFITVALFDVLYIVRSEARYGHGKV